MSQAELKLIVKVPGMMDETSKQKTIETVAAIYGVDSIAADLKESKVTIIGKIDVVEVAKKLKKFGSVEIVSAGPAKEEKKG
ncbi:heavy metal-associated isoprenylated plant protein 39-like [Wolffia australiana]